MNEQYRFSEYIRAIAALPNHDNLNPEAYSIGHLTDRALIYPNNGSDMKLNLASAIGVFAGAISPHSDECYFQIHACPMVTTSGWFGWGQQQQRRLQTYYFSCPNVQARSRWIKAIQNILNGLPVDSQNPPDRRRLKIFLNPISGNQQGRKIFQHIRPILEHSNLEYTLTETTYAGEIQAILTKIDLSEIDEVVIVGGDGSIHEAINGLISRDDWQTAIQKPIGVIPAGTGNGFAKTLLEIAGEPEDPVSAAFLIAKGKQRPLDIAIAQQNGNRFYSFLSLGWAIISDVDIESERLRFLGSLRTDIYALMRIVNLRHYPGRFSYLPATEDVNHAAECQVFNQCPSCSFEVDRHLPEPEASGEEWQVIEDDFVLLWAMNISYATQDIKAAPKAHLSDGYIDVILVRRGISKFNLLLAFLKSAEGEHLSLPGIEYYKVRRFRLEPLTDRGIFAVDGEKVDYFPIQMEVKRGLARAICG